MTNFFSGIITEEFKVLFDDAISALLEQDALTRPCTLVYSNTKMELCPNCLPDVVMKKSSNRYKDGGPRPFTNGQICPMCFGFNSIPTENYDTIYLACIFDSKKFVKMAGVNVEDIEIQTMSKIGNFAQLKKAKEIILDTTLSTYSTMRCQRVGNPEPLGLGNSGFIITSWKRV